MEKKSEEKTMKEKTLKIIGIAGWALLGMGIVFFIAFWITAECFPEVAVKTVLILLGVSVVTGFPGIVLLWTSYEKRGTAETETFTFAKLWT